MSLVLARAEALRHTENASVHVKAVATLLADFYFRLLGYHVHFFALSAHCRKPHVWMSKNNGSGYWQTAQILLTRYVVSSRADISEHEDLDSWIQMPTLQQSRC